MQPHVTPLPLQGSSQPLSPAGASGSVAVAHTQVYAASKPTVRLRYPISSQEGFTYQQRACVNIGGLVQNGTNAKLRASECQMREAYHGLAVGASESCAGAVTTTTSFYT